jgi:glucose/arabinose dehydrogenase
MRWRLSLVMIWGLVVSMAITACASSTTKTQPTATATQSGPTTTSTPGAPLGPGAIHLQPFVKGLQSPVYLTYAPGQTDRVYVVEQTGRVRVVGMDGTVRAQPFLDIQQLISTGGERGLLSIVFHPDYARNGYFFVDYTAVDGTVTVARYHVSANDPYRADPASAQTILLGKILRIDVDHTSAGRQYAIPSDNPFANQAGTRPEIWAYGLRNPWRYSFDRSTHDLYIGDAGQDAVEEIDYQPAASKGGQNYGWAIYEGNTCYAGGSACSTGGLTAPIATYTHVDGNCVIVGGYVYRGQKYPSLTGAYFYGDDCSGRIWSFPAADARDGHVTARQILDTSLSISSFGEDASGELYMVSLDGSISRITG